MDLTEYNELLGRPLPIPGRDGISGKPYKSRYFIDRRYEKPTAEDFIRAVRDVMEKLKGE